MLDLLRIRIEAFIRNHSSRIARVLMVGSVGFVVQTLIFETIGIRLSLVAASTAALIGGECALLSNFFLNDRFSFRGEGQSISRLGRLLRFHLVSSGSLATQWILVFIAEHATNSALILRGAYLMGIGIGFLLNYSGYYFLVWRRGAKKGE